MVDAGDPLAELLDADEDADGGDGAEEEEEEAAREGALSAEAAIDAHYAEFQERQRARARERAASAQTTWARPASPKSASQRSRVAERESWSRRPLSADTSFKRAAPSPARVEFRGAAPPPAAGGAADDPRAFAAALARDDEALADAAQAADVPKARRRAAEPTLMTHGLARGGFAFGPGARARPASASATRPPRNSYAAFDAHHHRHTPPTTAEDGVRRAQARVVEEKKRRRAAAEANATAATQHHAPARAARRAAAGADVDVLSWQDALHADLPNKVQEANDWSRALNLRSRYRVAAAAYGRAVFVERTSTDVFSPRQASTAEPMAPSDFAILHGRLRQQARMSARFAKRADEAVPVGLAAALRPASPPPAPALFPPTTPAAPADMTVSASTLEADVARVREALAQLLVDTTEGRYRMEAQAEALAL